MAALAAVLTVLAFSGWAAAAAVLAAGVAAACYRHRHDAAGMSRWSAVRRGSSVTDSRTRDLAVKIRAAAYSDIAALRDQVTALRAERAKLLDTYRGFEKVQFPDPSALSGSTLHQVSARSNTPHPNIFSASRPPRAPTCSRSASSPIRC